MTASANESAYYADPANQQPAGPARQRHEPRKTSLISVRFDPAVISRCQQIAQLSGMTASAWIRRAVSRETERYAREHARGTAQCGHLSVAGVVAASCGTCGPLAVTRAG